MKIHSLGRLLSRLISNYVIKYYMLSEVLQLYEILANVANC